MANKRDYYEVLGVGKTATESDIKSAFRKKAKECHPDLHPGDKQAEAQFKEINEAYEILSDSQKRAKYDQFGHAAFEQGGAGGGSGFGGFGGFEGFDVEDLFGSIFGSGRSSRSRTGPARGADLSYDLTIDFTEAAFGCRKEFNILRNENCSDCNGTGAKDPSDVVKCARCGGTGSIRTVQNTIMGSFQSVTTCPECGGAGKKVKSPCTTCKGKGRLNRQRKITVNIPAGIDNGQTISLQGEGDTGTRGGPSGDLYVNIRVRPHKQFTRSGVDLNLEMKVSFATAALGGEIQVPTLEGDVPYNLPAGTQVGDVIRLQGKGIKRLRGTGNGDLKARINIDVPKRLTDKQRQLLADFEESFGRKTDVRKGGIFSKIKGKADGAE